MQIKMRDILGFTPFYEAVRSQKLSIKTAYRLAQLAKAIDSENQFYREKLQAIILEYGKLDDNGQPIPTSDGQGIELRDGTETECYAAIAELQDIDVTLPDVQLSIDDFDNIELTTDVIGAVLPFFAD